MASLSKTLLLFIALLLNLHFVAVAQQNVYLDNIQNENDFVFPEAEIEKLLQPERYNAFFYGETHTKHFEPMFKLHFITYLNAVHGVKDVFMEMGYSVAVLFNQYLATGDTALLDFKVLYTSTHYMEFWKRLYLYNASLPVTQKIQVHGIDFEVHKTLFKALLILRTDNTEIPFSLNDIYRKIESYARDTTIKYDSSFFNKVKAIGAIFDNHKQDVVTLYGINTATVQKIISNSITMTDISREKKMSKNLQREIGDNHIEKFVAFFGGDHINYSNPTSLPVVLKGNRSFKNKIVSIRMFCFDAYDNWSHEIMRCIGTYDEKEGAILHKAYSGNGHRGVVIPNARVQSFLEGTADYYLFANDK